MSGQNPTSPMSPESVKRRFGGGSAGASAARSPFRLPDRRPNRLFSIDYYYYYR